LLKDRQELNKKTEKETGPKADPQGMFLSLIDLFLDNEEKARRYNKRIVNFLYSVRIFPCFSTKRSNTETAAQRLTTNSTLSINRKSLKTQSDALRY
jgi:hypothetical protein